MSYPTSFPTLSRSSSQIRNDLLHDYKPFEPWCLLLNESQPDVSMVQVPLMNPETCSKELQYRLAHVWGQRGQNLCLNTPSNVFYLRCDFQRVFDTGYFALLPNFELLKAIHNDVVVHRRLLYARRPKWTELYKDQILDFQFIPMRCFTQPGLPFVRRHHPRFWNYVEYFQPYTDVPPLRCHIHPYLVIYNTITKLDRYPTGTLPGCFQRSIDLACNIWNLWMTEKVPGPPLNADHRRSAALKDRQRDSPSPSATSPPSTFALYLDSSDNRIYCREEDMYPFYKKPRRDPPVPKERMNLPHGVVETEPSTVWTHPSSSSSRVGTPSSDRSQWWPDEHITLSCVDSASTGVWYQRDGKQDFIAFRNLPSSFDGSNQSYYPFDHPANLSSLPESGFGPQDETVLAKQREKKRRIHVAVTEDDDERPPPRDPSAFYSKIVPVEEPSVVEWVRCLKRHKPSSGRKYDPLLEEYRAEPSMPEPPPLASTWKPDNLSLWPKRTLKRRSEAVVKLSTKKRKRDSDTG